MGTKGANGQQGSISCGGRAKVAMGDSSCVGANRPKSGSNFVGTKGAKIAMGADVLQFMK